LLIFFLIISFSLRIVWHINSKNKSPPFSGDLNYLPFKHLPAALHLPGLGQLAQGLKPSLLFLIGIMEAI
jgi:hypothetical protein